jgi:ribosome recycling factor
MNFLLKLLPADKRALLELAIRITQNLDTPEERKKVAKLTKEVFKDGKVSIGEWAKLGSALGVFKIDEKSDDR